MSWNIASRRSSAGRWAKDAADAEVAGSSSGARHPAVHLRGRRRSNLTEESPRPFLPVPLRYA
eukprot:5901656-Prorocentrum_lima.AAC.1